VNFYRRFIPAAANILLPLTDTLRADWSWFLAPAMQHSFQLVKETLVAVATLTHPDPGADLSLTVDASNISVRCLMVGSFTSCQTISHSPRLYTESPILGHLWCSGSCPSSQS
jgi:hypothetical protein